MKTWLTYHSLWQHVAVPVWRRIPEKHRWTVVSWLNRSERRCWCDLVEDALCRPEPSGCACDERVPDPRPRTTRCATECGMFKHLPGERSCACYCGKYRFTVTDDGQHVRQVA